MSAFPSRKEAHRIGIDRVRMVTPELLFQELRSGRAITIIDIRDKDEFRGPLGRLVGSMSIPMSQLVARRQEIHQHRHEPIVVVSTTGARARLAAVELELAGFTEVRALIGGVQRWRELDLPLTFGSTIPPKFVE